MKYLVANLKMNMDYQQTKEYVQHFSFSKQIVFCPSFPFLSLFLEKNLTTGVQDISEHSLGSYTGEVSGQQVAQMGISYTIIGHSERRKYETKKTITSKIEQAKKNALSIILCVGEEENQDTKQILTEQLSILKGISLSNLFIAYEPVWAIGTGKTPTKDQIESTISFIKEYIQKNFKTSVLVLYGGSVDERNIQALNEISILDGFLVGKASCDVNAFQNMINILNLQ